MSNTIIGWDIGGAHVKVCVINSQGLVLHSQQVSCPLWQGIHELHACLDTICQFLQDGDIDWQTATHAVTMTGELVDCFPHRHAGVCAIAEAMHAYFQPQTNSQQLLFYHARAQFVTYEQVTTCTDMLASMNWHASAAFLSTQCSNALLIDIGSTTTDIVPMTQDVTQISALTDAQRMAQGTLIYTGVVRTPLMALAQNIDFNNTSYYVAAEYFATTADIYRLLGQLQPHDDMDDTADGEPKTAMASARRIARMIGHDVEDDTIQKWHALAQSFKDAQMRLLSQAIQAQADAQQIVGLGQGRFLIEEIADRLNMQYINAEQLITANTAALATQTATAFPAYAVAMLAKNDGIH